MDVSRRHFLALGQLLAVAAALPSKIFGAGLLASFGKAGKTKLSSFTMQTFLPLVNSSFPVDTGSTTTTWLTLLSVEDTTQAPATNLVSMAVPPPPQAPPPKLDSFALHFLGTGNTLAQGTYEVEHPALGRFPAQGTYEVEHPALGRFPLFIVPSASGSGRETYTAIFNHILTSQTLPNPPIRRVGTGQSFIQQGGEAPAELNQTPGATGSPAQVERNPRSGASPRIPR